jgi:hypothetical protein
MPAMRPGRGSMTTILSLSRPPPDAQELVLEIGAGQRIEGAVRLVEQQNLGAIDEGAGDRGALRHAAC